MSSLSRTHLEFAPRKQNISEWNRESLNLQKHSDIISYSSLCFRLLHTIPVSYAKQLVIPHTLGAHHGNATELS